MSGKSEQGFMGEEGITTVVCVEGVTFYGNINNGTVQNSPTASQAMARWEMGRWGEVQRGLEGCFRLKVLTFTN